MQRLIASSLDINKISLTYSLPEGSESKFKNAGTLKPVFSKLFDFIKHTFQIGPTHPEAGDLYPPTLLFMSSPKAFHVVNEDEGGQGLSIYHLPQDVDEALTSTRSFFCDALTPAERQEFYIPAAPITSGQFETNDLVFSVHASIPWNTSSCGTENLRAVEIVYHTKIPSVPWSSTDLRTGAKFKCP